MPAKEENKQELWLVGTGVAHSVAPVLHTFIAKELGLPWTYIIKDFANFEECLKHLKTAICAGAAVTMPWKSTIIPYLQSIDESTRIMAACNTVRSDENGKLTGSNHDWAGIAGALREGLDSDTPPDNLKGLIVGAGGAARAAVYALCKDRQVSEIYIVNRDAQEVMDLQRDVSASYAGMKSPPRLAHITSLQQAAELEAPFYAVGTVPDFEPKSPEEHTVKAILSHLLQRSTQKGVLVDMCYRPRRTRHIVMAEKAGWRTVQGWHVVGHQAKYQWRGWAGEQYADRLDELEPKYWEVLRKEAESNVLMKP